MLGPSFKPTHNMYIYFAQEGTIFCYSTKNVPNVGEASQICPSASTICANTQWQLVSDGTLQLRGDQTITRGILKLNGWSMVTTSTTDSGLAVRWIKLPKINAKAILLIAMAALLSILVASSLPHSGPSDAIANDPQYAPLNTSGHCH